METVVALDPNTVYGGLSSKSSEDKRTRCVSSIEPGNESCPGVEVERPVAEAYGDLLPYLFAERAS